MNGEISEGSVEETFEHHVSGGEKGLGSDTKKHEV